MLPFTQFPYFKEMRNAAAHRHGKGSDDVVMPPQRELGSQVVLRGGGVASRRVLPLSIA